MSRIAKIALIGLVILVLLACLAVFSYVKYGRVMDRVESLRQDLRNLEAKGQGDLFASLKREEVGEVRGELVQVGDDLRGLKSELGPVLFLAPYLGWLPVVGGDVAAAPDLLAIGIGISSAGDLIFEGLDPLLAALEGSEDASSQGSTGERLTAALVDGQPQFAAAQTELDEVRQRRERMNDERLMPQVAQLLERLDKYLPLLETGVQGLLIAPNLLGAEEPRTYLLLAQNDNELRATGGFISSVALLRIVDGRIVEMDFRDSYAVDDLSQPHPLAPDPLETYMLSQIWLIRDANWYPDFPASAQVARDLFQLDQGVLVDGVIAADLVALQALVGALGPIPLEEYGVEVSAANIMSLMREYWSSPEGEGQSGDWWLHRKDFMGEVLGAMLFKLETDIGSLDLSGLIEALGQGFEEKHILIYLADPTVSEILAENRWDGAVQSVTGDFLMVVDTNMGFNKVNPNIENSVDYQVLINEDGSLTGQATVHYRNNSTATVEQCVQEARYPPTYQEMMEGCYWNYVRVYVPEEGQLLQGPDLTLPEGSLRAKFAGVDGTPLPPEVGPVEAGKNVLATFFVVPPGEEREMVFQYQLPSDILEREGSTARYTLLVQKQPGTLSVPLQITVALPVGSEVLSTQPEATSLTDGEVEFQTNLLVDREVEIVFR
jgi:hypothetical protein